MEAASVVCGTTPNCCFGESRLSHAWVDRQSLLLRIFFRARYSPGFWKHVSLR